MFSKDRLRNLLSDGSCYLHASRRCSLNVVSHSQCPAVPRGLHRAGDGAIRKVRKRYGLRSTTGDGEQPGDLHSLAGVAAGVSETRALQHSLLQPSERFGSLMKYLLAFGIGPARGFITSEAQPRFVVRLMALERAGKGIGLSCSATLERDSNFDSEAC